MKTRLSCLIAAALLSACAGMLPPNDNDINSKPIVRFGEVAPSKDFVLFYPVGTKLPITTSVSGSLLSQADEKQLYATLVRDVYTYKHWISFDGKHWEMGNKLVSGQYTITLPGIEDGKNAGKMAAEFNLK